MLLHPTHSPDISPANFHSFCSLHYSQAAKVINDAEVVKLGLNYFFALKIVGFYYSGTQNVKQRLNEINILSNVDLSFPIFISAFIWLLFCLI